MGIIELILLAAALSMDAFAVAICKGLSVREVKPGHMIITGLWFGIFQAVMPLIGFFLAMSLASLIENVAPWIAFGLLALIGANMIRESFGSAEELDNRFDFKAMLPLAIATSIDAMVAGVSFAGIAITDSSFNVWLTVALIGVITFALSALGVKVGNIFGAKYKSKAELVGGIVLVLMGVKILLEHLGVINF